MHHKVRNQEVKVRRKAALSHIQHKYSMTLGGRRVFDQIVHQTKAYFGHDIELSPNQAWRSYKYKYRDRARKNQYPSVVIMPLYVYIHLMKKDANGKNLPHNLTKLPAKNRRRSQLGDLSRTVKQIALLPHERYMYTTNLLGDSPHGKSYNDQKEEADKKLKKNGIELVDLSHSDAIDGIINNNDVTVIYPEHQIMKDTDEQMNNFQFQDDLVHHYETHTSTSNTNNKNRDTVTKTSQEQRIDAGIISRYWTESSGNQEYTHDGFKLPRMKTEEFLKMPKQLLEHLFKIFEAGQKLLDETTEGSYPKNERYEMFAKRFNEKMGFKSCSARFEYYDILVSSSVNNNGQLNRHIDYKNDWRSGYRDTVVYSFHHTRNNIHYKVSIIMLSGAVCGAAYEHITKSINIKL